VGRPFFEALPELADQGLRELLDGVRQTGLPFAAHEREIHLAHCPQDSGFYNFTYEPQRNEQGQVLAITCVATDVTEQVHARQQVQDLNQELAAINEELQAANEELQAANEELQESNHQLTRTNVDLDNFIYTASHDLKQPITNIEGLLLALQHELPPAGKVGEVPTMLQLMQQAVERFGRTIAHLTDVSRLQQAHAQLATQVHLARVVQEVQLDLAPLIMQTNAQVLVAVPEPMTLLFSEKNLRSVVYNLLSNALKYRHADRPWCALVISRNLGIRCSKCRTTGWAWTLRRDRSGFLPCFSACIRT
jgi:light-regulated signal transduction histidine kinase (bacteriophytochrome)